MTAAIDIPRMRMGQRAGGVARLRSIVVINLESRPDRLTSFEAEMNRLGMHAERFNAIADSPGILGATRSHAECLKPFAEDPHGCVMVCEDDAVFKVGRLYFDYLVDCFLDDQSAEVACLAFGRGDLSLVPHSFVFMRGFKIKTAACYLAKASIIGDLRELWLEGAHELACGGDRKRWGIDMTWHSLQERRVFLVPVVRAVQQRPGHSDIEDRFVNYGV
jgi:hypothetical protein